MARRTGDYKKDMEAKGLRPVERTPIPEPIQSGNDGRGGKGMQLSTTVEKSSDAPGTQSFTVKSSRKAAKQQQQTVKLAQRGMDTAAQIILARRKNARRRRLVLDATAAAATVSHYTAEGLIHEELTGDGTFQSSANCKVPAASLTAGKWLFIFNTLCAASTFVDTNKCRIVEDDGTPTVLSLDDHRWITVAGLGDTANGRQVSFMVVATVTGASDVSMQMQNAVSTTGRINAYHILALNLDELVEGTDYFHDAVTTDVADITGDIWNDITTTITPTAGEDYLVFGTALNYVSGGRQMYTRMTIDGTANAAFDSVTDGDTNDRLDAFGATIVESMPALVDGAITMETQPFFSDIQDILSSQLFALRLNVFSDYQVKSADGVIDIGLSATEIQVDTLTAAANTGDYLICAMSAELGGGDPSSYALFSNINAAGETLEAGDVTNNHRRDEPVQSWPSSNFAHAVLDITAADQIGIVYDAIAGTTTRDAIDIRTLIMSLKLA